MAPGFLVPSRTKKSIYETSAIVRNVLRRFMGDAVRVPIDVVYEVLPDVLPGFVLQVCSRDELGNDHGRTYPDELLIQLREDVYDGMCGGIGRDRFTGAHELGHLFLHQGVVFARRAPTMMELKPYNDSEWQANTFASALLIDERHLHGCRTVEDVARVFGVSIAAARVRFKK